MPKLTKKAIHYGRTDPNYRKASLLKRKNIRNTISISSEALNNNNCQSNGQPDLSYKQGGSSYLH